MTKHEEQKIRETIDSLLPLQELVMYLKRLRIMVVYHDNFVAYTPNIGLYTTNVVYIAFKFSIIIMIFTQIQIIRQLADLLFYFLLHLLHEYSPRRIKSLFFHSVMHCKHIQRGKSQ